MWIDEFDKSYDVPVEVIEQTQQDFSWHNDACPSFGVLDENEQVTVVIWVEHPDPTQRMSGYDIRYAVTLYDSTDDNSILLRTNDLEKALEKYHETVKELIG